MSSGRAPRVLIVPALALLGWSPAGAGRPRPLQFVRANAAAIQATVDSYRAALGTLNANVAGSFGSGRREINWDGVPDASAAPNNLAANFFNSNSPRGVVFGTPGTGFQVAQRGRRPGRIREPRPELPEALHHLHARDCSRRWAAPSST